VKRKEEKSGVLFHTATVLSIGKVAIGENGLTFGVVSRVDEGQMHGSRTDCFWTSDPVFHPMELCVFLLVFLTFCYYTCWRDETELPRGTVCVFPPIC